MSDSNETALVLATMVRHRQFLDEAIHKITGELHRRAIVHDASKLLEDEFAGFCRINRTARDHEFGSDEYRASLDAERPTIDLHTRDRNSHHPEYWEARGKEMPLFDLIEMVCDWYAAAKGYDNGTFEQSLRVQRARREWSERDCWVIDQVATFLEESVSPHETVRLDEVPLAFRRYPRPFQAVPEATDE